MIKFSIARSLRVKILFGVLVISVVSFSIVIQNHLRSLDLVLSSQTKLYSSDIFPLLNSSIAPLLFVRDYASIEDVIQSFVDAETIEFVRIRDRSDNVVALRGSMPTNVSQLKENSAIDNSAKLITRRLELGEEWVGNIDYGFTMESIIGEQRNAINQGVAIAAFAIVLMLGILVAVVSFLTRSLEHLANGAQKVSDGDLTVKIAEQGQDEISETARAFNKMVLSLKAARNYQEATLAELKRQKEMLSTTQYIAHMGYWRLNLQNNRILFSEECSTIFGFGKKSQEFSFEKLFEIIHPDDVERVRRQLSASIKEKTSELSYRIFISDDIERTIYSKTELTCDKQGAPITLLGIAQDVTERYKIEQAHKESEARLRAAQKIASIGNIEWNVNDHSGLWADEVYQVFGVPHQQYAPTYDNLIKLVHVDDRDYVKKMIAACFSSEESIEFEYRVQVENGEIRWVNAILRLETDNKNCPRKIAGIVQNISARKISEERAHLLQKQLQQSQKMDSIGQLTGGIAHDFNNILTVIMGYSGLALDRCVEDDSPELNEYLQEVYHAGERATELISQMMTFSRTSVNEPQHLSIIPLVHEVSKMLGSILASSIRIETHFEENISSVLIDPVQLQQVIMNICINARDAMAGKGRLDITVKSTEFATLNATASPKNSGVFSKIISCDSCHEIITDGDYVEISIADSGGGIDNSERSQIFEPFYTTKDVGKGTGMGLSMVHGIVHEHHGHILIDSTDGGGAKFRIIFPSATKDAAEYQPKATGFSNERSHLKSANILIVDDEDAIARYIATLFEKHGAQVTVFTDSKLALRSYQSSPKMYDLLVIDQTMPELTGAEFAKVILADNPDFPIILCTGYSDTINEDHAMKLGIKRYLYKPIESTLLLNVANDLLSPSVQRKTNII